MARITIKGIRPEVLDQMVAYLRTKPMSEVEQLVDHLRQLPDITVEVPDESAPEAAPPADKRGPRVAP